MAIERRLGRGLGSLLSNARAENPRDEIPLSRIRPNPFQPRGIFDPAALAELQKSIESHGVLQPVVVRAMGDGYELISGERRFRAALAAGKPSIPAVVRSEVPDEDMLELALVENLQRADLDPLEKARGFRRLIEKLQLTQEEVAERIGLRRTTVTNHLRLLELPGKVQEAVAQRQISMGHARALLGLGDADAQVKLSDRIAAQGLSVRAVENHVRAQQGRAGARTQEVRASSASPAWVGEWEGRFRQHLGTKVQLRHGEKDHGQIVISYHDRADLERLMSLLAPQSSL